jgi:hypothetical protein
MEIEKGITKLKVPHEGNKITFQYPPFKGTYGNVANSIDKDNLKRPTSSKTASLVYDAFQNKEGEYESQIIKILNDAYLWEFTGNLYLPKSDEEISNGVILEYNPKIENGKLVMDKNNLVKRLKENDSNVKFVPFGFKTGEQNLIELQKNPYIVARYGKEGAEKISEVASKYKSNPYLNAFNSVDKEQTRMSALSGDWDIGYRLFVDGDCWYDIGVGHAFGIIPEDK